MAHAANATQNPSAALLAYPFRPFFLLVGLYGIAAVLGWWGYLLGGWGLPLGPLPLRWHAHEMLFGFLPAAIAGFLLTAMTNWTGAPPLRGRALALLVGLWVAGRLAMWGTGVLPGVVVAAVDLSFLPVLAAYVGRVLVRYGNRRNLFLVAVLALFALANLGMHLEFLGWWAASGGAGLNLALNLVTVLMIVIAGRITPAFTANWLRLRGGDPGAVYRQPWLERAAIGSAALMIVVDPLPAAPVLGAAVALVAAALNGARLVLWSGWQTWREPLLWVLHLGYAWVVVALLIKGLAPFAEGLRPSAWYHALGTGAMGTLILGVMTRVGLGHTGRPMTLPRFGVLIYLAVLLAGGARLAAALALVDYRLGIGLGALAWIVAFALFLLLYWPILSRPRADGRPG